MAAPNQAHEAMLRRHRPALVQFAGTSKVSTEKLAFVIADSNSRMGLALKASGIVTTERASVVLPITVDAIPALLAAAGAGEVQQLVRKHGAVPVIVIDEADVAAVSFCQVGARVEASVSNPFERSR
ncbi:MAG: hypothetical protein IT375_25970 [Polyangiaceae bacterium]|nr:hypothetical protein [Polyangiaceae bacterium]